MRSLAGAWLGPVVVGALGLLVGACQQQPPVPPPVQALLPTPEGSVGQIEVRRLDERPRLALVSREGDPAPALVAAVATDLGPAATVALASVIEGRLRATGLELEVQVDRSAFRVVARPRGKEQVASFLGALARAFAQPIAVDSPELALAKRRLLGLREIPLDAPELLPVAACTGRVGLAGNEPVPDLSTPAGARELEAWRRSALHAARTSISAVGPAAFCEETAAALERAGAWPAGDEPTDPWPTADTVGAHSSLQLGDRSARLTVAVRVPNARSAAYTAERLGAISSPLRARLAALSIPWSPVEVLGVARPRGGCISVTVEAAAMQGGTPPEAAAAAVAALVRQEIRTELASSPSTGVVSRQILTAADARDAAARAAWWALSSVARDQPERWATVLAVPPRRDPPSSGETSVGARFDVELGRALTSAAQPSVERRTLVERGQGEVWVLLASPCGVVEEGVSDAGATALAALSAVQPPWEGNVALEPWITPEGIGVIAHAPLDDESETPADLARRVADAAARALTGTTAESTALSLARVAALGHLERTAGPEAAAMGTFAAAIAPDHPSWVEPFGLWERVTGSALHAARHRWQALATGPLRVAVLANADAAQATAAAMATERWIAPRTGQRTCTAPELGTPHPGRYTTALPREAALAQALIGAPVGQGTLELARLTAAALDGEGGLLATTLTDAIGTRATARVIGGSRAAALVVDVRTSADRLEAVTTRLRELLSGLSQRLTESDLKRAETNLARAERDARTQPRRRLIDLWRDRAPTGSAPARVGLAAWRAWLATALAEGALISVEARPE
ncbi:hypothetical protein [Chondromyces crocatus]|uniref:Uncharacterized protein n=1 Tax=Chondromyces crocatus TaxID=52 RepID=A0A0K1EIM7_CHOCO|nr:hypothetical protein [Chondromyces crocatus]AKT40716.1 uncharacterized protein CMC5_048720 [Chondromyces crocatus]